MKRLLPALCLLLLAAPAAQAADGVFNLDERIHERIQEGVEDARQAEAPAQKRLLLSEAFRSTHQALERTKKIPGLPDATEAALTDLQHDIMEQHDRVNGLNGFSPVPDADLDRFGNDVQTNLDILNRPVTLTVGVLVIAALVLILIL